MRNLSTLGTLAGSNDLGVWRLCPHYPHARCGASRRCLSPAPGDARREGEFAFRNQIVRPKQFSYSKKSIQNGYRMEKTV